MPAFLIENYALRLTLPVEVVEAVEGDEAPPLQFMHFLLVEEWSELELVGES